MLGVEVRSSRWVLVTGLAVAACGSSKGDAVVASVASAAAGAAPNAATGGKSSSSGGAPTVGARAAGGASVAGGEVDTGGTGASDGAPDSSGGGGPGQAGQAPSMGGKAGSSNATTGQRCAPGMLIQNPYGSVAGNCYYWEQSHRGIPNIDNTSVRYIHLSAPTTPGKAYAVSIGMASAGIEETVELWGSDAQCGNAQELLWWGPLRAGEICAEFEPTQSFSNLLMVWRPLWSKSANAEHDTLTFCPTGSCGTARDGKGLGLDGDALNAPAGAFFLSAGIASGPLDFDAKVGYGWMHVKGHQALSLGATVAIDTGYFRMQASEGFDDAWYCSGVGSSFTWLQQRRAHFDFAAITQLADCKRASGGTGTATFSSKSDTGPATLVSSIAELADDKANVSSNGCFKNSPVGPCDITYTFSDGRPALRLHAYQSPTVRMQGQDLVQDFNDTALIIMPKDYGSPRLACVGQGSVTFAADGSTSVALGGITPFGGCPGQSVVETAFSGDVMF